VLTVIAVGIGIVCLIGLLIFGFTSLVSGWLGMSWQKAFQFVVITLLIGIMAVLVVFVGINVIHGLTTAALPFVALPKSKIKLDKDGLTVFARRLLCKDNSSRSKDSEVATIFKTNGRKALSSLLKSKQHSN